MEDTRQRQLFKNMVYVGALTALLDIDLDVLKSAVADQLKGKEKLVAANMEAVALGRDYALEHFDCPLPIHVRHAEGAKGKILVSGNDAGGPRRHLRRRHRVRVVSDHAVDVAGRGLREVRQAPARHQGRASGSTASCRPRTSWPPSASPSAAAGTARARSRPPRGPGISLMSEFLGLAYFAEVPVVLFNIQRGGPSTGMPTRTQQSDIISCAYASHGDTKHVLLFPANPTECFSMGAQAFDLAERLQTPVIVMSDLDIGMNDWVTDPFAWDDAHVHDRGKVLSAEQLEKFKDVKGKDWGRYQDVDGDAIPYRTLPGTHPTKGAFFTRGTSHDENARYTEDGLVHARVLDRIRRKFDTAADLCPSPRSPSATRAARPASSTSAPTTPAVREALDLLEREGMKVNALRLKAFPFTREVASLLRHARARVRRRAEPRRADALAADDGSRSAGRQADPRAQLRRHAADGRVRARRRAEAPAARPSGRGGDRCGQLSMRDGNHKRRVVPARGGDRRSRLAAGASANGSTRALSAKHRLS